MSSGSSTDLLIHSNSTADKFVQGSLTLNELSDVSGAVTAFTRQIQSALQLLHNAAAYAEDAQTDLWQFSVELGALHDLGLTVCECRWLIAKGLAKHARETTTNDTDRRVFQRCVNLSLPPRTCFVLGERGKALLCVQPRCRQSADRSGEVAVSLPLCSVDHDELQMLSPTWDLDRQQLRVGRVIVKEFKLPATNQEAVLAAFQEEGWAPRIDDPLAPMKNQDVKRRLHDTIKSLNRNQRRPLIRFLGDGKGQGVRWEFLQLHDSGNNENRSAAFASAVEPTLVQ